VTTAAGRARSRRDRLGEFAAMLLGGLLLAVLGLMPLLAAGR